MNLAKIFRNLIFFLVFLVSLNSVAQNSDYEKGLKDLRAMKFDEAVKSFSKSIQTHPDFSDAYFYRGLAFLEIRQWEKAVADFRQKIAMDPRAFLAYHGRATAHGMLEKWDLALNDLREVLRLNPEFEVAYLFQGTIYSEIHQEDQALQCLEQLLKLNPRHLDARYQRAYLWLRMGRYEEALQEAEILIKKDSKNPDIYFLRGNLYYMVEKYSEAESDFLRYLRFGKDSHPVVTHSNFGFVYFELGRYADSMNSFQKALSQNPGYADAYCGMALLFFSKREVSKARKMYEKAKSLDPAFQSYETLEKAGYSYSPKQTAIIMRLLKNQK